MKTGMPLVLEGDARKRSRIDGQICSIAKKLGATELHPPCLLSGETLRKAEYEKAFPQLANRTWR